MKRISGMYWVLLLWIGIGGICLLLGGCQAGKQELVEKMAYNENLNCPQKLDDENTLISVEALPGRVIRRTIHTTKQFTYDSLLTAANLVNSYQKTITLLAEKEDIRQLKATFMEHCRDTLGRLIYEYKVTPEDYINYYETGSLPPSPWGKALSRIEELVGDQPEDYMEEPFQLLDVVPQNALHLALFVGVSDMEYTRYDQAHFLKQYENPLKKTDRLKEEIRQILPDVDISIVLFDKGRRKMDQLCDFCERRPWPMPNEVLENLQNGK